MPLDRDPREAQLQGIARAGRLRAACFMALPMVGVLIAAVRFPELGAVRLALIALITAVTVSALSAGAISGWLLREVSAQLAGLESQRRTLERLALQDPLTGVNNRRGGELLLARSDLAEAEAISPLSVAVVDVDHLRELNRLGGHAMGDAGLRRLAEELAGVLRADDWVARWGGDEFLVVCHCTATDMVAVMDRVRRTLAANPARTRRERRSLGPQRQELEISVGVAELAQDETLDACIARADEALYAAKKEGRNTVREALAN